MSIASIFFQECFLAEQFKTGGPYAEKTPCIILTASYIDAYMYVYIYICCAFAGDSCQKSKPGNEKRKREVSGSYRVTKPEEGGTWVFFG